MSFNNDGKCLSEGEIVATLNLSVASLDSELQKKIKPEINHLADLLKKDKINIVFFAPHNSGKSTLINALLGQSILPMDIIHSTARPIHVRSGELLKIKVNYKNGSYKFFNSQEILESSGVLTEGGEYSFIKSFEVQLSGSIPFENVEIVDLPGTDDDEELDEIVKEYLFKADIVIQIINAQHLFKQQERQKTKEWLLDRGIDSIIFAVNFFNSLNNKRDQLLVKKEVNGISKRYSLNFHRGLGGFFYVNALPALQSRVYNYSYKDLSGSGLIEFQAALQTFVAVHKKNLFRKRITRAIFIANSIKNSLDPELKILSHQMSIFVQDRKRKINEGQNLEKKLINAFENEIIKLRRWLILENLSDNYHSSIKEALKNAAFQQWGTNEILSAKNFHVNSVNEVVSAISFNFGYDVRTLDIPLPLIPAVNLPSQPTFTWWEKRTDFFTDIKSRKWEEYTQKMDFIADNVTQNFLSELSRKGLSDVSTFFNYARPYIRYVPPKIPSSIEKDNNRLTEINLVMQNLGKITERQSRSVRNKGILLTKLFYLITLIRLHFRYFFKME